MISVTILVKNGERLLSTVLEALKKFNEIILLDSGSTDQTLAIASRFPNVKIYHTDFKGFGAAHNEAAALCTQDWILTIDCDEVLSVELANEIFSLQLDPKCVYSLPFKNYFNKKQIRCAGWHPESHIRLYHREKTRFSEAKVHEGILTKGLNIINLKSPIAHYPYESISDFLVKMERYSTLFAEQHRYKKKSSPFIAFYHGMGAFVKCYLLKRGFLGGYEGFLISVYNGHTAFYKYLKLYHANRS